MVYIDDSSSKPSLCSLKYSKDAYDSLLDSFDGSVDDVLLEAV